MLKKKLQLPLIKPKITGNEKLVICTLFENINFKFLKNI